MKVSKDAARDARRIFHLCTPEGKLDEDKIRLAVDKIATEKPRDYRGILHALKRLIRIEVENHNVLVESATDLDTASRVTIEKNLLAEYGDQLTYSYRTDAALLGGIRIRVGNDVLDGSVKSRLDRLANAF